MLADRSGRPWALRQDETLIAEAAALRGEGPGTGPLAALGEGLEGSDFARVVNGIAVIPVRGLLLRTMNLFFWSYEEIARDVALAQADDKVRGLLLDVDSPGGLVAGCSDCARFIHGSGPKPVEAFVGGTCASAAYYLSSAADRIILGSGAIVGSIGTVIEYVDLGPYFEKLGARIVRVVAEQSPNKRLDPDSEEGQAEMQALVNAGAAEFVADVATFRGITPEEVLERYGQGLVFDGGAAIERGMADARGTRDSLIAELAARDPEQSAASATATEEDPMDWDSITTAALREHRADIAEEIAAAATAEANAGADAARTEAAEAAATAERERLLAIDEVATPGHEELVAAAKADGKTTAAELALQILKAEKAAGGQVLSGLREADAAAAVQPTPHAQRTTTTEPTGNAEVDAKAEWDADPKLRAEFGDFDTYAAFRAAEASGRVRVLRRQA